MRRIFALILAVRRSPEREVIDRSAGRIGEHLGPPRLVNMSNLSIPATNCSPDRFSAGGSKEDDFFGGGGDEGPFGRGEGAMRAAALFVAGRERSRRRRLGRRRRKAKLAGGSRNRLATDLATTAPAFILRLRRCSLDLHFVRSTPLNLRKVEGVE